MTNSNNQRKTVKTMKLTYKCA